MRPGSWASWELRFVRELGDSGCDRGVLVSGLRKHRHAVVERVEFGFLALAPCRSILGILPQGGPDKPLSLVPRNVIRPFGVSLLPVFDQNHIWPDSAVG